jgi:hypothetical protein
LERLALRRVVFFENLGRNKRLRQLS